MPKLKVIPIFDQANIAAGATANSIEIIVEDVYGLIALQIKRAASPAGQLGATVECTINGTDWVTPSGATVVMSGSTAVGDIVPVLIGCAVKRIRIVFSATALDVDDLEAWILKL